MDFVLREGATEIADEEFKGREELESVTVPDGVKKIGKGAFFGCRGLKEIHLPDSLTEIGMGAFEGCDGLRKITYHRKNESIVKSAFYEQWRRLQKIVLD